MEVLRAAACSSVTCRRAGPASRAPRVDKRSTPTALRRSVSVPSPHEPERPGGGGGRVTDEAVFGRADRMVRPGHDLSAEGPDEITAGLAVALAAEQDAGRPGDAGRARAVDRQLEVGPQQQPMSRVERHRLGGRVVDGAGHRDRAQETPAVGDEDQPIVADVLGRRRVERLAEAQDQDGRLRL